MTDKDPDYDAVSRPFVQWARDQAIPFAIPQGPDAASDLDFLGSALGDIRIVALGESAHYLQEWNLLRTRLFQYLVEQHGYRVFVLESGLVEGKILYDYVLGADIEWDSVVAAITNGWGVWSAVQELICWMREYNAGRAEAEKLRFYGMDGSGNWYHTRHVFAAIRDYLDQVDADLAARFAGHFEGPAETIGFENRAEVEPQTWQDQIAQASLFVSEMEQRRVEFSDKLTPDAYDWALRYAFVLRDQVLCMAQSDPDFSIGFKAFWNVRDAAMADQLAWIIAREGETAGFLIGAHNTHLQQVPVRLQHATSMGSYIAQRVGRDKIRFAGAASAMSVRGDDPLAESNQRAYSQVGPEGFFLDLRQAPGEGAVRDWLDSERLDRSNLRYQPLAPGRAWDWLFYQSRLSIAEVALPDALKPRPGQADPRRFSDYVGRYFLIGFLVQPTLLDISEDASGLYADGRADTNGELFPPRRTDLVACEDGSFTWSNWPATLRFKGEGEGPCQRIVLFMPGMGTYEGTRVDD